MDPRSAYVHIPFCHRRCFYCDFPVVPLGDRADGASSGSIAAYLPLLHREIASSPAGPPLATVYLGGGTPSMLTGAQVAAILEALECRYGLAQGAELSLELDPASFDQARLADYLAAGINRVSLGGQSFDDRVLADLGRRHRGADLREAAGWLRRARHRGELASWSLDLIQGLPRQGLAHWDGQLAEAIALEPPHLSVYDLSIEPGTVFERRLALGQLALPPEDLAADLMDLTWSRLTASGYGHYEVSNYALPGHASRHNRVYWSGAGWWGFGMGATGAPRGRRRAHPRTRAGYAEMLDGEALDGEAQEDGMPFDERLMVGLRCREGVNLERLARQECLAASLLDGLRARLEDYERRGLLRVEGPRWRLADPEGLALSNGVLREMLAWWQELERPSPRGQLAPAP